MVKRFIWSGLIGFVLSLFLSLPVQSQILGLPNLPPSTNWFPSLSENMMVSKCIYLDGVCVIKITSSQADIEQRTRIIEQRLRQISKVYFQNTIDDLKVWQKTENELPNIYIATGGETIRLLTVTRLDSENDGIEPETKANQMIDQLIHELKRNHQERTAQSLRDNSLLSLGIIITVILAHFLLTRRLKQLQRSQELLTQTPSQEKPISAQFLTGKQWNLKEAQYRFFQLLKWGFWLGGILLILGQFPHSRNLQLLLITLLRIPLRIGLVGIIVYLLIRLSYALISQLSTILLSQYLLELDINPRVQLRVKTLTVVAKSIIILIWVGVGIMFALSIIGINIVPLLTGLGILGVGISLASQNLIRDGINGFFIIIEDQYAVGDMIEIDKYTGLVENINLRITQLRDAEGKLVTIPNSEIKTVANLSNQWSRSDVSIPIAYDTDVDQALLLIKETANQMKKESPWREMILEDPQVLGIENFSDRGLMIRVWLKTQPLKQWDVSREFRRRLKIVFEKANIPIPLPQQHLKINMNE
jgi:small conductance mechanosensitive channel